MQPTDFYEIAVRIIVALVAGALIGYERSYRGRPAGFRTHALVCMASAMLMLVTVYEAHWVRDLGEARLDPTRMAQGIMTGIGFLGAGVIMQEGFSVRGLTTAASIWNRLDGEGRQRRHSMTLASADRSAAGRLAVTLEAQEGVQEIRIAPTGD